MAEVDSGDLWENYEDRLFLTVWVALLGEESGLFFCTERRLDYRCTRPRGHTGRHIARAAQKMCAAWPGALPPRWEDLL